MSADQDKPSKYFLKKGRGSYTKTAMNLFDRIRPIIPWMNFYGGGLVPEIPSQMLLYIS